MTVSRDQELFDELIGPVVPRISTFPHLVLVDGVASFWPAVALASIVPGWWGETPLYDADGGPFMGLDEVSALRIWGAEANQRLLRERLMFAKLGHLAFFS